MSDKALSNIQMSKKLSIMVVDDARISTVVVRRALDQAGYTDLRSARSGADALAQLDERPADIIVADWLMPEMDGLALTHRIREFDEVLNRYTYVILLTAKEGATALQQAFDEGVDDFVHKSSMAHEMLPRIMAGERLVKRQNRLLNNTQRLLDANGKLRKRASLDPLTGMDTANQFIRRLASAITQCEKRGGACTLVVLHIDNMPALKKAHRASILQQLLLSFSHWLSHLVRPMDILGRIGMGTFALLAYQDGEKKMTPESLKRRYDQLNNKVFKTRAGFITLNVSVAMSENDGKQAGARQMLEQTYAALRQSRQEGDVIQVDVKTLDDDVQRAVE